jgi:hypothetical protein
MHNVGRAALIQHHHPRCFDEECDSASHPSIGTESGLTCTIQSSSTIGGPHGKSQEPGDSLVVVSEKAMPLVEESSYEKVESSADRGPDFKDQVRYAHQTTVDSGNSERVVMHSSTGPQSESKTHVGALVSPEEVRRDVVPKEDTDEGEIESIPSNNLEKVTDPVPDFKDQIRQGNRTSSSPPNVGCFPISNERRRVVDLFTSLDITTTAMPTTTMLDVQSSLSAAVPVVVNAVLVTTELLVAEEVTDWSEGSGHHSASPGGFKGMDGGGPYGPASERQFWMRIIVLAMVLNSLVVGGAVAGGFCAVGHCQGSNLSSANVGTMVGSAAVPAASPMPSAGPSAAPSASYPMETTLVDSVPTVAPTVGILAPTLDVGLRPKLPPSDSNSTGTLELAPPALFRTAVPTPVCANCNAPTSVPLGSNSTTTTTTSPTPVPLSTAANSSDQKNTKHVLLVLVPILVGVETLIVVGLFLYYRRWKRHQQVFQQQASSKAFAANEDDELRI